MITIRQLQGGGNMSHRFITDIDMEKVQDAGRSLNIIISTAYAALVNSATNFIVDYVAQVRKLPICRGTLKSYVNKIEKGMRKFDLAFKYEFPNLDVWQRNLDLTDAISDRIDPVCRGIYFAISNELGKTQPKDRDMLANMIVGAILLRQAVSLFGNVLEKARMETNYNFRPYFDALSAKCIEHPFGEAFAIISKAYDIDAQEITNIMPVRTGIDAVVNIMGNEKTYREAQNDVENS